MKEIGPIGVFDSGYGGLTVLSELQIILPEYEFLYLGDNARAPYGSRSFDVVYKYTLEAVTELFSRGCSLVIVACNTASAKALRTIQQIDLPKIAPEKRILGVIRPSTEIIGDLTKSGHVGILATQGTVNSESYIIELSKFSPSTKVVQHACPMWVPLIENNRHNSEAGRKFIQDDVRCLLEKDPKIDVLVLACTHFPLVKDYIESIVPSNIEVLSQGKIVAEKLVTYLKHHPEIDIKCSKNGQVHFLTTENELEFNENASTFYGSKVIAEQISLKGQ
jgi:glutamate racemase